MSKKKILGLDLGISSIGWALINIDDGEFINKETGEIFFKSGNIIDCGVRIFDPCENPKDKSASSLPRREARLLRRRLTRKSNRCKEIRQLCSKEFNLKVSNDIFVNSITNINYKDVWVLRKEAIERKLDYVELTRVLCHIIKHRGWKSRRRSEEKEGDSGAMKSAIEMLSKKLSNNKTPGFYYGTKLLNHEKVKNETGNYEHSIGRKQNLDEIKFIFSKQREFGNNLTKEFEDKVINCFDYEKETKSIKDMVGFCRFEKNELRAPKESFSAELFNVYNKINNLKIPNLNNNQFEELVELFKNKKSGVSYFDVRKKLALDDSFKFVGLNYYEKKKNDDNKFEIKQLDFKDVEKEKIYTMKGLFKIKDVLSEEQFDILKKEPYMMDIIIEALCYEKSDHASKEFMLKNGIREDIADNCLEITTKNFLHLSIKAIQKILPYLKLGYTYDKACEEVGYDFKDENSIKESKYEVLPNLEIYEKEEGLSKLTNPVVKRTLSQTRKVINAIINKYGAFDQVNIEFTRDLGKSVEKRKKIEKSQKDIHNMKEKYREEISRLLNINKDIVSEKQVLKIRLYYQQDGKSMYSFKSLPDLGTILTDDKSVEIDHILPYSKSFDDSLNNKVLVLPKENQDKGNRTCYEYLKNSVNWEEYEKKILSFRNLPYIKKKNLLVREPDFSKWKARNLSDTSYAARYLSKYLKTLKFAKNKIQIRPGTLTSYLRHILGIKKIREESDTHHAVDAIIIACATQSMCQLLSIYSALKHNEDIEDIKKELSTIDNDENNREEENKQNKWYDKFDIKIGNKIKLGLWEDLKEEIEMAIKKLSIVNFSNDNNIISRMPRRKITGQAHKETIYGIDEDKNIKYLKTRLNNLNLINLEKLADKDGNSKNLYNILKNRLQQFDGDGEKAFKEPIYMYSKNNQKQENTPLIKSVKLLYDYKESGVKVNNGIADNNGMPRIDIFYKDGQYHTVVFYIADFVKNTFKTISKPSNIDFSIQKNIHDENDKYYNEFFKFSLYKDELVFIETKNDIKYYGYFTQYNFQTGQFYIETIDKSNTFEVAGRGDKIKKISISTFKVFKKFQVDPLGYIREVKHEKRQGIINNIDF